MGRPFSPQQSTFQLLMEEIYQGVNKVKLIFVVIGKQYQEQRMKKRERKQPGTIPDLPYLNWEKTGQPPSGPFAVSYCFTS